MKINKKQYFGLYWMSSALIFTTGMFLGITLYTQEPSIKLSKIAPISGSICAVMAITLFVIMSYLLSKEWE